MKKPWSVPYLPYLLFSASLNRLPPSRKAWACRIPLPIILLVLSCFIALFSFAAHAACSAYAGATAGPITGKISINEYNYSGNYVELKIIDPSIVAATNNFTGWVLSVYKKSGGSFTHETFSVRDAYLSTDVSACGTSSPYIKIPVSSLGNDSNVVLWSSAPALLQEVDYFRVGQNAYPTYQPSTCFADAEFPASSTVTWHQSALTGSAARKDIARGPDGTGVWIETPYSGSDQGTPCTTNDSTLLLSKSVTSNTTVMVGEQVSFRVDVSLSSRASTQSNVIVNDLLPSGLSYLSHTASAGAYIPGTGVWTIGSLSAGRSVTLNITARTTLVGVLTNSAVVRSSDFPAGTISAATAPVTALQPLVLTKTVSDRKSVV